MSNFVLVASFVGTVLGVVLCGTAIFLVLVVLVQRGRGGGLAGALGGMGGQSAFGSKAGDLFTRITIAIAFFWIVLCAVSVKVLNTSNKSNIKEVSSESPVTTPGLAPPPKGDDSDSE